MGDVDVLKDDEVSLRNPEGTIEEITLDGESKEVQECAASPVEVIICEDGSREDHYDLNKKLESTPNKLNEAPPSEILSKKDRKNSTKNPSDVTIEEITLDEEFPLEDVESSRDKLKVTNIENVVNNDAEVIIEKPKQIIIEEITIEEDVSCEDRESVMKKVVLKKPVGIEMDEDLQKEKTVYMEKPEVAEGSLME